MTTKPVTLRDLTTILQRLDGPNVAREIPARESVEELQEALRVYFDDGRENTVAVVGVDIYRYSAFDAERQRMIPVIFRLILDSTLGDLAHREALFFPESSTHYQSNSISTGDGGFLIVTSPLAALAFAIYFEAHLQWFNSYISRPNLRAFLGPLTVRWAITFETVFSFENNSFGTALITNARLLASDRLNRCLLDSKSVEWFQARTGSVENLWPIDHAEICDIMKVARQNARESKLFQNPQPFRMAVLQKVETMQVKTNTLDVYSLFVQARIPYPGANQKSDPRNTVVSLGNLNSQGLSR